METNTCWEAISDWLQGHMMNILRSFSAKLPVLPAFLPVWPLNNQNFDLNLFFNNYEAIRRSYSKLYLFLNYNKMNPLVWFFTTLKQLLNLTPVQTLWSPGFLYRMWPGGNMNYWSFTSYNNHQIFAPYNNHQLLCAFSAE